MFGLMRDFSCGACAVRARFSPGRGRGDIMGSLRSYTNLVVVGAQGDE